MIDDATVLKNLTRLVFLCHPYAWEVQFRLGSRDIDTYTWGGFSGREILAMERKVSRRWPGEIQKLGPEEALVVVTMGIADREGEEVVIAPVVKAAREHLNRRGLIVRSRPDPAESLGRLIKQALLDNGYTYDPSSLVTEAWGQSFEGCAPNYSGHAAAGMGLPLGFPMRYDLTFPDAPFAMTAEFVERVPIANTDLSLYLFEGQEGRPFAIYFPGVVRDDEPTRIVRFTADPSQVEFSTKRGERRSVSFWDGTYSIPLHVDGSGDPIYIWGNGVTTGELKECLINIRP